MSIEEEARCMEEILIYLRDSSHDGPLSFQELKLKHSYPKDVLVDAMKSLIANQYVYGYKNIGNNETTYLVDGLTSKGRNYLQG